MVDLDLAKEVLRLLSDGTPLRAIARRVPVSRDVVRAIARRTWAGFRRYPLLMASTDCDDPPSAFRLPPCSNMPRCPQCGYKVELPCQICRARAALARAQAHGRRNGQPETDQIGLQLRDEHETRYREVRGRKAAELEAQFAQVSPAEPIYEDPEESDLEELITEEDLAAAFGEE
jgi:hypothetical protein